MAKATPSPEALAILETVAALPSLDDLLARDGRAWLNPSA
jgi:hypothetical protein